MNDLMELELLAIVAGAVFVLVLAVAWFQAAGYQVQRHWLEVRFHRFCVRRFPFQDVEGVELGASFPAEFWPTRGWLGSRRWVTVRLRRGWIRRVVLTPERPEQFCRDFQFSLGRKPKPESDGETKAV
jgi:hypothetical protein